MRRQDLGGFAYLEGGLQTIFLRMSVSARDLGGHEDSNKPVGLVT